MSGEREKENESVTETKSVSFGKSHTHTVSVGFSRSETTGESTSRSEAKTSGQAEGLTRGFSVTSGSAESSSGVQGAFSEGTSQSVSAGWSRSWARSKGQETPVMESDEACGLLLDTIKVCIDREKEGSRNVGERISYGISGGKN